MARMNQFDCGVCKFYSDRPCDKCVLAMIKEATAGM